MRTKTPEAAGPLAFRWAIVDPPYSREWGRTLHGISACQYSTPGGIVTEAMRVRARVAGWGFRHSPAPAAVRSCWSRPAPAGRVCTLGPPIASGPTGAELWFNTLQRRCLRRGDYPSADALEAVIT